MHVYCHKCNICRINSLLPDYLTKYHNILSSFEHLALNMMVWKRYILWWHIHLLFKTSGCNQTHHATGHHRLFTITFWLIFVFGGIHLGGTTDAHVSLDPSRCPVTSAVAMPQLTRSAVSSSSASAVSPRPRWRQRLRLCNGCKSYALRLFCAGKLGSWLNGYMKSWFSILGPNKKT